MTTCLLFFGMTIFLPPSSTSLNSMLVNAAYASDSQAVPQPQPRQRPSSFHVERPLSPPFPNGPCDGTVITIPQKELFPGQRKDWNLSTSYENTILPPRDVKVWLPREYHSSESHGLHFPVLYCHDGQNGELHFLPTSERLVFDLTTTECSTSSRDDNLIHP